jgi:hypothetical protein
MARKIPPMKRLGTALALLFVAAAALAQSAEYGRAGGDEIALPFKKSGTFSGSFNVSTSSGDFGGKSFGGTIGGALIADKLWFFGAMQRDNQSLRDLKLTDVLGPRNSVTASAIPQMPQQQLSTSTSLSLRYTGMLSSSSFFNATVTSSRQSQPAFFTHW